ncbi:MAG TPA: glucans biosynthesis glucosyltransferase MdoH [Myxococcota bacterium]|nr:glucans biosynthesis glucosyltransferase MdoH [Myxococcota bacterium]
MSEPIAPLRPLPTLELRRMGVPLERLLEPWDEAHERARRYAEAAGASDGDELARRAALAAATEPGWPAGSTALERTLRALRRALAREGEDDALSTARRWLGRELARDDFAPAPPLARASMVSRDLHPSETVQARRRRASWVHAARRRRTALVVLIALPALIAARLLSGALPSADGGGLLKLALTLLFGALFGWISFGFWTALVGAWVMLRGDRFLVTRREDARAPIRGRTALVMPICGEPVARVFAGLRATLRSLERAGAREHFDVFVLSDSADPDVYAAEVSAWAELCRELDGFGRVFYRRRRSRINKKSGNIADFLRRWGSRYAYFVVLDADSVMSGETLRRLVALIEANPEAAVIQTVPAPFGRRSLFGRITQFASRLHGPLFAAGLHFWQLGDVPYWGHNAIVRCNVFMQYAALPRLRGRPPFGGPILSHDFVEAALLGRAGYSLWLAFDLAGSFEETPATLLEEMRRDRRWCQGNFQHLRLLFEDGFFTAHRALFLNGAFAYASALLWLAFLVLGSANALVLAVRGPVYFPEAPVLYPAWPVWHPAWTTGLAIATGALLFLPKLLACALVGVRGGTRRWGGAVRLFASVALEAAFAALLAPIRMMFHARFVLSALLGRTSGWPAQERGDVATRWHIAMRQHAPDTVIAGAWALAVLWLDAAYFPWLAPVLLALTLGVPTSVLSSRARLGAAARRAGLFVTPEESEPPEELRELAAEPACAQPANGFERCVVDPIANAAQRLFLRATQTSRPRRRATRVGELVARALGDGPGALDAAARRQLLEDPAALAELHERVWTLRGDAARSWGFDGGPTARRTPSRS